LLDANILLYATDESSRHHQRAANWLSDTLRGSRRVALPWQNIGAFVRIVTHPWFTTSSAPDRQRTCDESPSTGPNEHRDRQLHDAFVTAALDWWRERRVTVGDLEARSMFLFGTVTPPDDLEELTAGRAPTPSTPHCTAPTSSSTVTA